MSQPATRSGTDSTGTDRYQTPEAGIDIDQVPATTRSVATPRLGQLITDNGGPGVDVTDTSIGKSNHRQRIFAIRDRPSTSSTMSVT